MGTARGKRFEAPPLLVYGTAMVSMNRTTIANRWRKCRTNFEIAK